MWGWHGNQEIQFNDWHMGIKILWGIFIRWNDEGAAKKMTESG
jgi:hypothetical protein